MTTILTQPSMTMEEMYSAYAENNPGFIPNKTAVGRYARKQGYKLAWQKTNGVKRYFYIKNTPHV